MEILKNSNNHAILLSITTYYLYIQLIIVKDNNTSLTKSMFKV